MLREEGGAVPGTRSEFWRVGCGTEREGHMVWEGAQSWEQNARFLPLTLQLTHWGSSTQSLRLSLPIYNGDNDGFTMRVLPSELND